MNRLATRLILVAGTLIASSAFAVMPQVKSPMPESPGELLVMHADHPVMHRAIRRARAELADFLELAESPRAHQEKFAVRVMLLERNEAEYIWVSDFKQDDNSLFAGVVSGDIHMQSRFKRGDRFTFLRGDIVDWTYTDARKGRVHGAYTECALLTLAPPEVAARTRKKLKLDCEF